MLSSIETLICSLIDWYDKGDSTKGFDLLSLEGMWVDDNAVTRPMYTWRDRVCAAVGGP